ncbi:MAG TPA: sulfite exporter TauE/SafE family protein [Candidatus Hydrogenedentes bacterium]|nr:sulfite exporter TauE/SafE family protein [Candidatus Hydrogenedentota bacterium]
MSELMLPGVPAWIFWLFCVLAVLIQGISKSGFAGGAGILSLPLMMLVMPVNRVAPALLPILILCDMNALYHHWQNKVWRLVWIIFLPSLVGTLAATWLWFQVGNDGLNQYAMAIKRVTGVIAVVFALYILAREASMRWVADRKLGTAAGILCGVAAGFTSTLAHAAGPIVGLYLFSQGLGKALFVGTTAWVFTFINLSKVPFYQAAGLFDWSLFWFDLALVPCIPVGSWMGKMMHDRVSEVLFNRIIMVLTLLAGIQLVFNINLVLGLLKLFARW